MITDSGKLSLIKLGECKKIDALVETFRKNNTTFVGNEKDREMSEVCSSLYNELIAPLKTYIGDCNDLVISPEGKLNFVPFAAFVDHEGKFVVEKTAINYVSSGRELLKDFVVSPNKTVTIVADPLFSKSSTPSSQEPIFPQLPGTAKEAELVQGAMTNGNFAVTLLEQTNASKNAVLQLDCPRILHIATHGFNLLNNDAITEGHTTRGMKIVAGASGHFMTNIPEKPNPMFRTGLAFYGANDSFREWNSGSSGNADGILTAAEVPLINLNGTSLVALSACQTGEGEAVGGEGVFGLRRGFLQSGAKNLLMTLWPIADQETVGIMYEFYKKIALNDDDPCNSLSEVQRQWMPKLKSEKGICYAINRAAPFIIFTKGKITTQGCSESSSAVATSKVNPMSQDVLDDCVHKTKVIMDQKIQQNAPSIQELCTEKFKKLLKAGLYAPPGDQCALDADFRYDTQDDYPKVNSTGPAAQNGEKVSVPVELQFGTNAPFTKTWVFAQENGTWLLDDVLTQKGGEASAKSMADDLSKLPSPPESGTQAVQSSTATSPAGLGGGSPAILEFADALAKADAGDAYAQGVVSIYFTMGYKTPKDVAKGLSYAMKSASQKNPLGIYQVGILRELGAGMKKSKKEGRVLMAKAFDGLNAMSGDPYALYDLGMMALEGVGVDQNPKEAARLFKASADLGYAPAQRIYAKFLEAGVGAPKDLEAARQYQSQSSAQWSEQ